MFNFSAKNTTCLYPKVGSKIGHYTVIDIAGAPGGTAIVLICKTSEGKMLAVKRFYADKVSATLRGRIYEESNMNLKSSYLVTSTMVFEEDGYIHSVMPFIRGKSLSDILCSGDGVAAADVVHLGTRLAIAACDLHRHNIISTDIKPDNILINKVGHVKIIDLTCFERIGENRKFLWGQSLTPHQNLPNGKHCQLQQIFILSAWFCMKLWLAKTHLWLRNSNRNYQIYPYAFLKYHGSYQRQ